MTTDADLFARGVRNMLRNCAGLTPGDSLLILHEPKGSGYYSDGLPDAIAQHARARGLSVTLSEIAFTQTATDLPDDMLARMREVTCTLFLARRGDQVRFRQLDHSVPAIMCYALDEAALASRFGTAPHGGFLRLKDAVNAAMRAAAHIEVTCPLGTSFSGRLLPDDPGADVTVKRFPMAVFAPNDAAGFAGRVVQHGFLVGCGSTYYDPYACPLEQPITISFNGRRIGSMTGRQSDIERARAHYAHVARQCDSQADYVHSWHAGIHPGCAFPSPASAHFMRWSGSAFGNPRLLHFHTCADYAPGEISLNVLDPTIRLDGVAVWDNGRLFPDRIAGGSDILSAYPDMRACFEAPETECGLGPDGQLSFH